LTKTVKKMLLALLLYWVGDVASLPSLSGPITLHVENPSVFWWLYFDPDNNRAASFWHEPNHNRTVNTVWDFSLSSGPNWARTVTDVPTNTKQCCSHRVFGTLSRDLWRAIPGTQPYMLPCEYSGVSEPAYHGEWNAHIFFPELAGVFFGWCGEDFTELCCLDWRGPSNWVYHQKIEDPKVFEIPTFPSSCKCGPWL
jgi:hypothetical protein